VNTPGIRESMEKSIVMAGNFKFELVSPERVLVATEVSEVLVPGADGDFTVFAGHAPVISTLRPGILDAKTASGTSMRFYIAGGFCEVAPDSLTVLAEKAHDVASMSAATIASHVTAAEAVLAGEPDDEARLEATTALAHLKSLEGRAA
jgi:F-type H+-transporting ATPase subunit epsilon